MSFSILLQKNLSEKNKLNKTLTTLATLTGTLRNESSIVDPTILIEGDVGEYSLCNYLTIEEFSRSYFVTNITSIRNNIFEITAHCDVLSSFASQIRSNWAIVFRQQNNWNLYLNDGAFKVYQNPMVVTKVFPNSFNTMEFVLAIAG